MYSMEAVIVKNQSFGIAKIIITTRNALALLSFFI